MALWKPITLDNGVVANYHKIWSISFHTNGKANCFVLSYVNKNTREIDVKKNAVRQKNIAITTGGEVSYQIAYNCLKEQVEEFYGAEDC